MNKNLSNKIYLSLTGKTDADWKSKIKEINDLKLDTIALFLSRYKKNSRKRIYSALEKSSVKNIPLIHIRNDMGADEIKYLCEKYKNPWLTIHEISFKYLSKWKKYLNQLCLEMNYDNRVSSIVEVEKIGGFCIDLAHFKSAQKNKTKEFKYITGRKNKKLFKCNRLGGYSYSENRDLHTISNLKEFDYLKTLPKFLYSDIIAIEVDNPIADQILYKKYILNLLK